jgi:coenzyme F420-reducing hydrogenase beta subunit
MRTADLSTGSAKLHKAWQKLMVRWEETKHEWHDSVSSQFEEKYLTPMDPQITSTLQRMRSLAAAMSAAENDCDENRG